jgi:inhibitor of cysteine peptidase
VNFFMWKRMGLLLLGLSLLALTGQSQVRQVQNSTSTQQQKRLPGSKKRKKKIMKLQAQDSGRSLDLHVNDSFSVELGENPTTGYRWQILENGAPALRITHDSFVPGQSQGIGAGGTRVLEFIAGNAGTASIHLGYARSGDPASLKNEFRLQVQVSPR